MAMYDLRLNSNEITRIMLALENDSSDEALATRDTVLAQRNERSNNYGVGHQGDATGYDGRTRVGAAVAVQDENLPPELFDWVPSDQPDYTGGVR